MHFRNGLITYVEWCYVKICGDCSWINYSNWNDRLSSYAVLNKLFVLLHTRCKVSATLLSMFYIQQRSSWNPILRSNSDINRLINSWLALFFTVVSSVVEVSIFIQCWARDNRTFRNVLVVSACILKRIQSLITPHHSLHLLNSVPLNICFSRYTYCFCGRKVF